MCVHTVLSICLSLCVHMYVCIGRERQSNSLNQMPVLLEEQKDIKKTVDKF